MSKSNKGPESPEQSLEKIMAGEVWTLYLATMATNPDFQEEPYLDMYYFRKHYATVAHRHGIVYHLRKVYLSPEEFDERRQYSRYFGLVRPLVSKMIKKLKKERTLLPAGVQQVTEVHPVPTPHPVVQSAPPEQPTQRSIIEVDHYRAGLADLSAKMKAELGPKLHQRH